METHDVSNSSSDLSSEPYLFFGMINTGSTYSSTPSWFHSPSEDYFNAKFKLARTGETITLYNPGGTVVNQVVCPAIDIDNSYGRKPDGGVSFCYMPTPTPVHSNNSTVCYKGYGGPVMFSKACRVYCSSQNLT